MQYRRSSFALAALLLVSAAWTLAFFLNTTAFLSAAAGSKLHGRTAMKGFKEDFAVWKSSLSDEDKKLLASHRKDGFNKKYLNGMDPIFKSPEKIEEFTQIFKKFMDAEVNDYKQKKLPIDEDLYQRKIENGNFDLSLKPRLIELDRDAMRRFDYASARMQKARDTGERYIPCSPKINNYLVQNNDTESHELLVWMHGSVLEVLKEKLTPEQFAAAEKDVKPVPPIGQHYVLENFPVEIHDAYEFYLTEIKKELDGKSEEDRKKWWDENFDDMTELFSQTFFEWKEASASLEAEVDADKAFFKSLKDEGKTKADVVQAILENFKEKGYPVEPVDEDTIKELAKIPAIDKFEIEHSWGTASKLWKSEAYDPFGNTFLLGVYETPEEALQVFNDWNAEYEQSKEVVDEEIKQFQKEFDTLVLEDSELQEVIYKEIADARAENDAK